MTASIRITLSHVEHDVILHALDLFAWDIEDKHAVFNSGQRQACRFTSNRIRELRERLVAAHAEAVASDTAHRVVNEIHQVKPGRRRAKETT